jgi:hypothetical protein
MTHSIVGYTLSCADVGHRFIGEVRATNSHGTTAMLAYQHKSAKQGNTQTNITIKSALYPFYGGTYHA